MCDVYKLCICFGNPPVTVTETIDNGIAGTVGEILFVSLGLLFVTILS